MAEILYVTAETGGLPVGQGAAGQWGAGGFAVRGGDGAFFLQGEEALRMRLARLEGTLAEIRDQIDEALGAASCQ